MLSPSKTACKNYLSYDLVYRTNFFVNYYSTFVPEGNTESVKILADTHMLQSYGLSNPVRCDIAPAIIRYYAVARLQSGVAEVAVC